MVAQAAAAALNATLTAEAAGGEITAAATATPEEAAAEERRRKRKSRWGPTDDGGGAAAPGGTAEGGTEGEPRKRKSRWAAEEPQQSMVMATINQGALMLPGGLQVQLPGSMLMATGQVRPRLASGLTSGPTDPQRSVTCRDGKSCRMGSGRGRIAARPFRHARRFPSTRV